MYSPDIKRPFLDSFQTARNVCVDNQLFAKFVNFCFETIVICQPLINRSRIDNFIHRIRKQTIEHNMNYNIPTLNCWKIAHSPSICYVPFVMCKMKVYSILFCSVKLLKWQFGVSASGWYQSAKLRRARLVVARNHPLRLTHFHPHGVGKRAVT